MVCYVFNLSGLAVKVGDSSCDFLSSVYHFNHNAQDMTDMSVAVMQNYCIFICTVDTSGDVIRGR